MIDIMSLEPTKISRDLKGKFILIYGEAKAGKTSFSSLFPKPLLLGFEHGFNALSGIYATDVTSWSDFKRVCQQLKTNQAKEKYSTVIIDTVGIATDLCEKYVLAQNGVSSLGEIPWGGGWSIYRKEFESPFRELSQLGYGIVFIAHSKTKPTEMKDSEGEPISSVYPDVNKTGFNAVNRLVDVIAYLSVEFHPDGTSDRYLYTRQTPTIFAGSRYKYLETKIPFGYNELVNAIADAIEKEAKEGAEVTDHTILNYEHEERSFQEAFEEAKQLWAKLTENENVENLNKIHAIIKKHFGKVIKLSEVTENQLEPLEDVISDMREL